MAGKKNELGPTGRTVASNVKRLRLAQNLTYAELARRLEAAGRPIPVLALSRIEDGARRVDPDDLTALAAVLGVWPGALLMPRAKTPDEYVQLPGIQGTAAEFYGWFKGETLPGAHESLEHSMFEIFSRPPWQTAQGYRSSLLVKRVLTDIAQGLEEQDPDTAQAMFEFIEGRFADVGEGTDKDGNS